MIMTIGKLSNITDNLNIHSDKFVLSRDPSKFSSMVISNSDFFNWINSRYSISRKWQSQFSTLVYLLIKHAPMLHRFLLENITILPISRDYYINQNFLFNINLLSSIFRIIIKDRAQKNKLVGETYPLKGSPRFYPFFIHPEFNLTKYKSHSAFGTQPIFSKTSHMSNNTRLNKTWSSPFEITTALLKPQIKGSPRFYPFFIHPEFNLTKYKSHSAFGTQPIFSKTSNMSNNTWLNKTLSSPFEITTALLKPQNNEQKKIHPLVEGKTHTFEYMPVDEENTEIIPPKTESAMFHKSMLISSDIDLKGENIKIYSKKNQQITITDFEHSSTGRILQFPFSTVSPFLKTPPNDQNKTHYLGKNRSWTFGHEPIYEKSLKKTSSKTESAMFHKWTQISADTASIRHKSKIDTGTHKTAIISEQLTKSDSHSFADGSVPLLHHHNPWELALVDIKKSIVRIEKKVAEGERFIEKSGSGSSPISHKTSDIMNKMDIKLGHLTDQVYEMLEKKIEIERERRGLYG